MGICRLYLYEDDEVSEIRNPREVEVKNPSGLLDSADYLPAAYARSTDTLRTPRGRLGSIVLGKQPRLYMVQHANICYIYHQEKIN